MLFLKDFFPKNIDLTFCAWTPDKFLCDWISSSPVLTFSDFKKSTLVGIASETNTCQDQSEETNNFFKFLPVNSVRTMTWIANTIKTGECYFN